VFGLRHKELDVNTRTPITNPEMSRLTDEPKHERDWHDFPECAQSCLLSKEAGYWWRNCARSGGECCPGAKPGIKHLTVWDCVLQQCDDDANDHHVAQETAQIFMRECAVNGYPVPVNFTNGIPDGVNGDHFPGIYEYKDFGTAYLNQPFIIPSVTRALF